MIDSTRMLNIDELSSLIASSEATPIVRPVGESRFAVDVPNPLFEHDYITVFVHQQTERRWFLSDVGHGSRAIDGSFGQLVSHFKCAGLDLGLEDDEFVQTVVCDADRLPHYLARFAAQVVMIPTMGRLLDCATRKASPKQSRTRVMAESTKTALERSVRWLTHSGTVGIERAVNVGPVTVTPKLAVYTRRILDDDTGSAPMLVCEFIDLTRDQRSVGPAYKAATGTFVALHDIDRRFLIAHGDSDDIEAVSEIFDEMNITTLADDDLEPLIASVSELEPA